ncbi:protein SEED AND ROOT HAIR PROTECTIVE PROTEIN-like [Macadamia integrifolia]|uniref:protein SEED AND ROOT HAIR PROTECTIVE PROTEIN-like n=1 Tax=Macadamia integrifolia TaxID=60698 RepID=UPI001C4F916F|nr:protein SEED AND ROOT HAIR PROTECTIVE PROTEIN-like [Macadamia integrifolia]
MQVVNHHHSNTNPIVTQKQAEAAMAIKHVLLFFLSSLAFLTLTIDATNSTSFEPKVIIGVQGVIYCKSGSEHIPIEGAKGRVTCLVVDENGYESAITVLSDKTDKNGYFIAKLYPSQHEELEYKGILTRCKAYLNSSPLRKCRVPTDIKKGMSGAPLLLPRILPEENIHLYSVGPFVYTSEPEFLDGY